MTNAPTLRDDATAEELRQQLKAVVLERAYVRHDEPFQLSSGGTSHDYVDMRRGVARGSDLALAAHAVLAQLKAHGFGFDAIGGMTMGADPVAHAVALIDDSVWYSVRKAEKQHGSRQRIEGVVIGPGTRAIVFEDTVSTGRSLIDALDVVLASGATVVAACTLLDRGTTAGAVFFRARNPVRGASHLSLILGSNPLERDGVVIT